jgi:hypothetical protein
MSAASTTADPAALLDMAAAAAADDERRATAAAAAAPSSSQPSRYSRRPTLPRHELPLDLLLHPSPSSPEDLRAEASRASCARARRDAFEAPRREALLMLQAAALPVAVWAYGLAQSDSFCRGDWDRYWTHVPRVRLPQLRARGQFGQLEGTRIVFMRELDSVLRATTRWIGRTPPALRPRPKGPPGGPNPPMPPPRDW